MAAEMAAGTYTMSANVHDNARDEDAVGYVTVIVNAVPQIAFDNQGSVQLLIAEESPLQLPDDFIRADCNGQSLMDTFKQEMAAYMGGDVTADVFSVQVATLQTRDVPVLNVRFNARGSGYRDSAQLNGLVAAHRADLQRKLNEEIVGVGIDMCKFTQCGETDGSTSSDQWMQLYVAACKLLETLCTLPAGYLSHFQMFHWAFVSSVSSEKTDIFKPFAERINELLSKKYGELTPEAMSSHTASLAGIKILTSFEELRPFFYTLANLNKSVPESNNTLRDASALSGSLTYKNAVTRLESALYVDFSEHLQF